MSEDGGRHGRRFLPGLEVGERDRVRDYHLFPTLLVSRQPDYLLTYRLDPRSAGLTRVVHARLVHPESVGAHEGLVAFWDRLNAEDARAVERQQRGVRSRGYEPGLIAENEDGLWRFLQEIVVAHRRAQD